MAGKIEHAYPSLESQAVRNPLSVDKSFQIYRIGLSGERTLLDNAPTYWFAEHVAQKYGILKPGKYAIVEQGTGQATVLNFDSPPER
jgi:hypothetical protein